MPIANPKISQKIITAIDDTATAPSIAIGNEISGTGIRGSYYNIKASVSGTDVMTIDSNGITAALNSSDGSAGLTQNVSVLAPDGVTTIVLHFKNGLLTSVV